MIRIYCHILLKSNFLTLNRFAVELSHYNVIQTMTRHITQNKIKSYTNVPQKMCETNQGIADMLNIFFQSVFSKIYRPINNTCPDLKKVSFPHWENFEIQLKKYTLLSNIWIKTIVLVMMKFHPSFLVMQCAKSLAPSPCALINTSLELGQFPENWRYPIDKLGDKSDITNY